MDIFSSIKNNDLTDLLVSHFSYNCNRSSLIDRSTSSRLVSQDQLIHIQIGLPGALRMHSVADTAKLTVPRE